MKFLIRLKAILINYYKKIIIFLFFCALPCKAGLLWELQNGIDMFNVGDYPKAQSYFTDYLNNNPNDEMGYYYLAITNLRLKNRKDALINFEKSYNLALSDKNLEKINFKNNFQVLNDYFDMAVMYFKEGNFKEADFYADLMLKLSNKNSNAWFLKAKIANAKGEKEEAINNLNKAILYNPKLLKTNLAKQLGVNSMPSISKENYYQFAFEDFYKGNIESAVRNCTNYLELDNTNIDIYILLSELYLIKNDTPKALLTMENAEKIQKNSGIYLEKAKIYKKLEDFEKEENALLKAYKINPNSPQTLYELGNFYLKKENYNNSLKYFEALVNTDDGFYEGYFGYILSLVNLGKTDSALNYIRKASSINPLQSEISYVLSLICFKQGQFKEAKDYIDDAISKQLNPNYLLLKSQISYYSGNYDESFKILNDIKKSNEKVFNKNMFEEFYIKNLLKLKQYQNAQDYFDKPDVSLDKNSLLYKYNLYQIYKLEGNDKKASIVYNRIKSSKYNSLKEIGILSEIMYEQEGLESAIKLLDKMIKKSPDVELYFQKIKIYSLNNDETKIKEVLSALSKNQN